MKKIKRNQSGFSLLAVTCMGAIASIWLLATVGMVLPTYQRASQQRYYTVVRSSAEAALDYTVKYLDSVMGSSGFDSISSLSIPSQVLSNSGSTVSVSIANVSPTATSSVYDPQLDPTSPTSIVTKNLWRRVTVVSTLGSYSKSIQVLLKPSIGTAGGGAGSGFPYYKYAVFGRNRVSLSGNARTDGYHSSWGPYGGWNVNSFGGPVGANGPSTWNSSKPPTVDLSGNAVVGGSLSVLSGGGMGGPPAVTRSGNAVVNDQLFVNGTTSGGFQASDGATPLAGDTVKGLTTTNGEADGIPRQGERTISSTINNTNLSQSQESVPSGLTAPSDAYNVGSINVSANGRVIIQAGAPPPPSPINVSGNSTLYIPPGDYNVTSFTVSGNGQFILDSGLGTNPALASGTNVRMFVQGNTAGSNAIQISGNALVNNNTSVPAKFQFWYNGSKNVALAGNGNLHALIYAPNSSVNVSGNGNYFGSIFAANFNDTGNGMIHYDRSLANTSYASSAGLTWLPATSVTGLQTVSWREL